jgi:hypothetical protein
MTNVAVTAAPQAIVALAAQAARAAAAAIGDIARQVGASIQRPGALACPESPPDVLRIVSRLEHAKRAASAVHAYRASEGGLSWHEAGALLGFGELAGHSARTVGEMAVDYAVGPRQMNGWFDPCPAFRWECPGCRQAVADYGPAASPARSQQGHADGCERLAADAAEWEQEAPQ